jgi:hypothetical protein
MALNLIEKVAVPASQGETRKRKRSEDAGSGSQYADPQRRRAAPPDRASPRGIFPGIGPGNRDSTEATHTVSLARRPPTTTISSEAAPDPCQVGEHPGSAVPVRTPEGAGTTADSTEDSKPRSAQGADLAEVVNCLIRLYSSLQFKLSFCNSIKMSSLFFSSSELNTKCCIV